MLQLYAATAAGLRRDDPAAGIAPDHVWIDLLCPTAEEEQAVEQVLCIEVPTREEMQEIEISSRLYREDGALFMTATLMSQTETEQPQAEPVTFILVGERLVTIRYSEPKPFQIFAGRAARMGAAVARGEAILLALLDAVVDRTADILERLAADLDRLARDVFEHQSARPTKTRDFQEVLRQIGRKGDINSKLRESLVSIGRLLAFLSQGLETQKGSREARARIKTLYRDAHSLTDHASFQSNKINFLLDATLGMINIEQNAIIKIFSVAAVVFLPPTLIASIYGMNFEHMPELRWLAGYPLALALMVLAAILPYLYFKRRGWL
jgi:magnesium transporter